MNDIALKRTVAIYADVGP